MPITPARPDGPNTELLANNGKNGFTNVIVGIGLNYNVNTQTLNSNVPLYSSNLTSIWSGIWASTVANTLLYTAIAGSMTITINNILANATTAGFISLTNPLPNYLWPSQADPVCVPIRVRDNGVDQDGMAVLAIDGSIKIYKDATLANFSGLSTLGTSGFYGCTLTYRI